MIAIDKERLTSDPDYMSALLKSIKSKEDFIDLAELINTPPLARQVLKNANDDIYQFSLAQPAKSNKGILNNQENFLTYLLELSLLDTKYSAARFEIIDIFVNVYEKYPTEVLIALDNSLKSNGVFGQNYFLFSKDYIPYSSNVGEGKLTSAEKIISVFTYQLNSQARQEIKIIEERFPSIQNPAQLQPKLSSKEKDIINIIYFLKDSKKVKTQLKKIEGILEERAGDRFDDKKKTLTDYDPNKHYKHGKLLSNYIKEWAEQAGFKGWSKLKGQLEDNEFSDLIITLTIFKDKNFRVNMHGEFSHTLQLICVDGHNKEALAKGETFLFNDFVELMKWIGEADKGKLSYLQNIWGKTFDNDVADPNDFTVPESINQFLISPEARADFPVLHQLLVGRRTGAEDTQNKEKGYEVYYFKKEK